MNALHSTTTTAVLQPRQHTAGRNDGKSGAANGRGCARGTGRQTAQSTGQVTRNRPPYMTAIEGGAGAPAATATATATIPVPRHDSLAEAEFTAYVKDRRASLYATAYHLTGDRYEAEDLLQSALFSTYRAWDRISDKAAVGGYLRRTMTNLHISAWRRRKLNEYPTEELPETVGESDAMGGTELRAVLWQALAKVPETQRTMLVLRYYEGRTDPEIADILGISVGTVKSSIRRSLRRMREDEALSFGRDEEESFGELVA
ncbi:SigE family RNA polymerase sigma factor [Streptomyces sp. H39-C1]|uniref:SigE family RNA polymerase sigma factor n=1 Tax=Streptomyces sp. H39-C1 TaxID=3004355 RepID=UPI0022AEF535|nr:SigE family RNA polymerase sigma factor [Streptomyces sp. H39-C1]MCZ4099653.1 SigE family RNA polymerase sigma factor [Streptomyces sp. H39-C1]